MPVSPARRIAFETLRRVEAEGAYASDVLHAELGPGIKPMDAALATEITMGVLRWRRLIDFLLERHLKESVAGLDLPVALALRMGAYQLRYLDKIPARAAVHEAVELVKRARKFSAASLVNAVLRRAAVDAKSSAENFLPSGMALADRLGVMHSHPTWMVKRWLSRIGEPRTIELLEANNRPPRLACAIHDSSHRDDVIRALERAGLRIEPGSLLLDAVVTSGGSPVQTELFRTGKISIQDEASQAIPLLLDVHAGDRVLDVCAAPGGKTLPLVRAAGSNGLAIATDRHAHRLRAMRAHFKRLGVQGVYLVELDAAQRLPFGIQFNRILVDAPCSGTGTLSRHPEIRWRLRPEQLAEFHRLQVQILSMALERLALGGRLVYSTCSIEPEENEAVVEEALQAAPSIRRVPTSETQRALGPHLARDVSASGLFDDAGDFRTFPGQFNTDGFFAAVVTRPG